MTTFLTFVLGWCAIVLTLMGCWMLLDHLVDRRADNRIDRARRLAHQQPQRDTAVLHRDRADR